MFRLPQFTARDCEANSYDYEREPPRVWGPATHQHLHFNNLIMQNKGLCEQIAELSRRIEKYSKLEPYINTLISRNEELEQMLADKVSQIGFLAKNIEGLHAESKQNIIRYESRLRQLEADYQGILAQAQLNNQSKVHEIKLVYEGSLREHKSEVQRYRNLSNSLHEQIQKISTQLAIKNVQNTQLQKSIQVSKKQLQLIEQQLGQVRAERDQLQVEIKRLQDYNKQISRNYKLGESSLIQKLSDKQSTLKETQRKLREVQAQLAGCLDERNHLQISINGLQSGKKRISADYEQVLTDFRETSLRKAQVEHFLEEALQRVERRQGQLAQLQQFREQERSRLQQEINKLSHFLQLEKQDYAQSIEQKSLKNQQLLSQNQGLQAENDKWGRQNQQLSEQIRAKSKQIDEYCLSLHKIKAQLSTCQQQICRLNLKIQEMENNYTALEQQYEKKMTFYNQLLEQKEKAEIDHEQELQLMRQKIKMDRQEWSAVYQEHKAKIKAAHQFEKQQLLDMYVQKINGLEAQIQGLQIKLAKLQASQNSARASKSLNKHRQPQVMTCRDFLIL